jgi:hypothetical protein
MATVNEITTFLLRESGLAAGPDELPPPTSQRKPDPFRRGEELSGLSRYASRFPFRAGKVHPAEADSRLEVAEVDNNPAAEVAGLHTPEVAAAHIGHSCKHNRFRNNAAGHQLLRRWRWRSRSLFQQGRLLPLRWQRPSRHGGHPRWLPMRRRPKVHLRSPWSGPGGRLDPAKHSRCWRPRFDGNTCRAMLGPTTEAVAEDMAGRPRLC